MRPRISFNVVVFVFDAVNDQMNDGEFGLGTGGLEGSGREAEAQRV